MRLTTVVCCSLPLLAQAVMSGEADADPVVLPHGVTIELPAGQWQIYFETHADCAAALRSQRGEEEEEYEEDEEYEEEEYEEDEEYTYVGPETDDDIEAVGWLPPTFHPRVWMIYSDRDDIAGIVACASIGSQQLIVQRELDPALPLAAMPPVELVSALITLRDAFVARDGAVTAPPPAAPPSPAIVEAAPPVDAPEPYTPEPTVDAPLPHDDDDDSPDAWRRGTLGGKRLELGLHQLTPVSPGVEEIASPGMTIAMVAPPKIWKAQRRGLATQKHLRGGFSPEHGLLADAGVGIGYGISGRSLAVCVVATFGVDYIGGNDEMMFDPDLGAYYGYAFAMRLGNDELGVGLDVVGELVSHAKHIDERRVDVRLGTNKLARRAWTIGLQYRGYDEQASLLGVTLGMGY